MKTLIEILAEIEDHTDSSDLKKKIINAIGTRPFFHLAGKIERLHQDKLRKLNLIEKALGSTEGENELYNEKSHFLQSRYRQ